MFDLAVRSTTIHSARDERCATTRYDILRPQPSNEPQSHDDSQAPTTRHDLSAFLPRTSAASLSSGTPSLLGIGSRSFPAQSFVFGIIAFFSTHARSGGIDPAFFCLWVRSPPPPPSSPPPRLPFSSASARFSVGFFISCWGRSFAFRLLTCFFCVCSRHIALFFLAPPHSGFRCVRSLGAGRCLVWLLRRVEEFLSFWCLHFPSAHGCGQWREGRMA